MTSRKPIHLAAIAVASALALPAAAQHTPWYAGLSLGQSKTDSDFLNNREGTISNASNIRSSFDDKDSAWKATLGYRFSPLLSVEANYADYGNAKAQTAFDTLGGPGGVTSDREVKGFGVDLVLAAPLGGDRLSVFGRVGAFRAETRAKAVISGNTVFTDGSPCCERSNKHTETVAKFGVGLDWNITRMISARLEYERLAKVGKAFESGTSGTTGEADMDALMLGVLVKF